MKPRLPDDFRTLFEDRAAAAIRALRGHLELGEIEAALGVYKQARARFEGWAPPPLEWVDLIRELVDHEFWDDAVLVMQDYLETAEAPSSRVRMKLAQLLIQKQGRPARALRELALIPPGSLSESLEPLRIRLQQQAERMLAAGPLELGDEV